MATLHPRMLAPALGAAGAVLVVTGAPAIVAGHNLSTAYESPLPLAAYLVGAASAVALSFVFVLARDMRAGPPPATHIANVPAAVRIALRAAGLIAWVWIMAQGVAGGSSDAAVASLFLWVYCWVGVAMLSALVGPVWEWLDPFATLHDIGAWALRQVGIRGWAPSDLPPGLQVWPAVAGLAFFTWLELVAIAGNATLTVVLAGYTLLTLALMAQFGRDQWRAQGETFSVWFRTLNRLAPAGVVPAAETLPEGADADALDPDAIDPRVVVRRPFASALLEVTWTTPRITLVAVGVGSILFDGLSQTVAFASLFGAPALGPKSLLLVGFLALIAGAALAVARTVSPGAIGAGLLPIAVGYLVAHYLTFLAIDGQRIVIAISDPLQRGDDLLGTAFYQVSTGWLPPGLVWTVQLAAVVGGHMLGAWSGHVTASRDMEAIANGREPRDMRHRKLAATRSLRGRNIRAREVPLALVMVALTTLTLWSLGQSIVQQPASQGSTTATIHPA
jgi:hypothetical protein